MAQQSGTLVEAITYFQSAAGFDPTLTEASKRLSTVSTSIRTGNIGTDARNAITARNAWIPILNQADEYYKNHLPVEIKYSTKLKQTGLNYQKGTVDLQFSVSSYESNNIRVMNDILSGLSRTGKKREWGFEQWPLNNYQVRRRGFFGSGEEHFMETVLEFALLNDHGRIIATQGITLNNRIKYPKNTGGILFSTVLTGTAIGLGTYLFLNTEPTTIPRFMGYFLSIGGILAIPNIPSFAGDNIHRVIIDSDKNTVTFKEVNANDITDKLAIKVLTINGYNAEQTTKSGYIRIISSN
ncbi:MAG: hypothetical protein LBH07_06685 [Treponema sp.]|nr:hypothetical protein [Treponema sp.]